MTPEDGDIFSEAATGIRIVQYLNGELDDAGVSLLDRQLQTDPRCRAMLIQYSLIQRFLIHDAGVAGSVAADQIDSAVSSQVAPQMDDAMILPALREDALPAVPPESVTQKPATPPVPAKPVEKPVPKIVQQPGEKISDPEPALPAPIAAPAIFSVPPTPAPTPAPAQPVDEEVDSDRRRWLFKFPVKRVAAVLIAIGATWLLWPLQPPAKVTAVAAALKEGHIPLPAGQVLEGGEYLQLTEGAAEVTFSSGATLLVWAPAQVHIVDRNRVTLVSGSVYAHVPARAIGFQVDAPGLQVVDRGTNFGVRVAPDGKASEVHVLDGRVDATALDSSARPTGAVMPVTANHAVMHKRDDAGGPVVTKFEAGGFDRDIAKIQLPVSAPGSGFGVAPGSNDPIWQVLSVPKDPNWQPKPAVVLLTLAPSYLPNSPSAAWISTKAKCGVELEGDYHYRGTVDLSGFEPASVSGTATIAVDDVLVDMQINGEAVDVPKTPVLATNYSNPYQISFHGIHWHAGVNQVDMTVHNNPYMMPNPSNYTGFQLEWHLTGSVVVKR